MNSFTRFVILIYVLRMFMPIFGIIPSPLVILMALFILKQVLEKDRKNWIRLAMPHLLVIYLMLFLTDIMVRPLSLLGVSLYAHFILWVLPFIYLHIYHNNDTKLAETLLYGVIISMAITAFTTYLGCLRFPGISRHMATGELDIELPFYLNIGGFDTIYIFVLMIPILCYRIRYCKIKKLERVAILTTLVFVLMAVFQSEYTTAILFSIVALSSLFLRPKFNWKKMILLSVIIGVAVVLSVNLISSMLLSISENIESASVSGRLTGVALMLQGQEGSTADEADVQGRMDLLSEALQAFTSSPIYGVQRMVGGHSYVFGIMAYYGLLGILMLIIYFGKIRKLFAEYYENCHCSTVVILTELIYISFLILNPRLYLVVPFLFLPLFSYYNNKTIKV